MTERLLRRFALFALVLLCAAPVMAQAPGLTAVWPPGGRMGEKVAARVEGGSLGGATAVLISGQGVKAQMGAPAGDGNSLPLMLEIAPDAAPGPREVRVVTAKGVSNPGYVWVGTLPEIAEAGPNSQPDKAMKLEKLPVTVYGRVGAPEEVDWYQFHADAGETLVMDICAYRLYSPLDSFLELRDAAGHLLASASEGYDRDPRLIYAFKTAGIYRLQVRDTLYRGGGGFLYKLTVGKLPVLTALTPPGGKRGETLTAAVEGVNLGDMKTLSVALPSSMPENQPWWIAPQTPNGPALPVAVAGDDNPQMTAGAPGTAARPVAIPGAPMTVNARLGALKETHHYLLRAVAGKPLLIEITARAIGARTDAYLRILDSAGKEIMNTEEQIGRDPQVTFTAPATGDYRLEISSIDAKGGPDYYYRLSIGLPNPASLRLSATPDNIALGRGQTVAVTINAAHQGDSGITLRTEGLPPGVTTSPLTLNPGQSQGVITLTAAADAPFGNRMLRFVGTTEKGGITRTAVPIASLPRPGEGQAAPRPVEFQAATVTADVPLYSLSVETQEIVLEPGKTVMLKVKAARKPNDNNANPAIALSIANLPDTVSVETPAIPEKQGEVTIKFTAVQGAKPLRRTGVLLTGKLGDNNVQPAPALTVIVK